jgi:hypothetical protein
MLSGVARTKPEEMTRLAGTGLMLLVVETAN